MGSLAEEAKLAALRIAIHSTDLAYLLQWFLAPPSFSKSLEIHRQSSNRESVGYCRYLDNDISVHQGWKSMCRFDGRDDLRRVSLADRRELRADVDSRHQHCE
jgi:hypothetical protein